MKRFALLIGTALLCGVTAGETFAVDAVAVTVSTREAAPARRNEDVTPNYLFVDVSTDSTKSGRFYIYISSDVPRLRRQFGTSCTVYHENGICDWNK